MLTRGPHAKFQQTERAPQRDTEQHDSNRSRASGGRAAEYTKWGCAPMHDTPRRTTQLSLQQGDGTHMRRARSHARTDVSRRADYRRPGILKPCFFAYATSPSLSMLRMSRVDTVRVTKPLSSGTHTRRPRTLTFCQRFVLMLEWETLFPLSFRLPVMSLFARAESSRARPDRVETAVLVDLARKSSEDAVPGATEASDAQRLAHSPISR